MLSSRTWIKLGANLAALAVLLGAFAAHALPDHLEKMYASAEPYNMAGHEVPMAWKRLQDFHTGAEYQMYHALGLIAVGLVAQFSNRPRLAAAGWCFLLGILLFSGSLYLLVLTGVRKWGAVTPIGGVLFIIGWIALALAVCPCGTGNREPSRE